MALDWTAFGTGKIKKGLDYIKNQGVSGIWSNVKYKMSGPGVGYNSWFKEHHEVDQEEISRQKEVAFLYSPKISLIVPVYMTPEFFLRSMIDSVVAQTYDNWQLCLVDGSQVVGEGEPGKYSPAYQRLHSREIEKIIRQYMEKDDRISYRVMDQVCGISFSNNVGLAMADGEYVAILNHDDLLVEDALFCIVSELQEQRYQIIYGDEDRISEDGTKYSEPCFKPDYSPDLLKSTNYIKHFPVVTRNLALGVGGYREEYDGAQDYDFIIRCCENVETEGSIKHISRVLYHWRKSKRATINNRDIEYVNELGKKIVAAHLVRTKQQAVVKFTDVMGIYRVCYDTPSNPLVSIVVSVVSEHQYTVQLVKSLYEKTRYSNFELILVDKETENTEKISYYHTIEAQRRNIHVVTNGSLETVMDMRNYGASIAAGKYIIFLDNNLEIMSSSAIGEMLGYCMREEVAVVSGTLYNDKSTIAQQGVVVGVNGVASYLHQGIKKGEYSYMQANCCNANRSAVGGSCLMVKKTVFDSIGGFSNKYKTDLGAIDLCMRVTEMGYYITCLATATWNYHGKVPYFSQDTIRIDSNRFQIFWGTFLEKGDPFYNSNYSRKGDLYALSREEADT